MLQWTNVPLAAPMVDKLSQLKLRIDDTLAVTESERALNTGATQNMLLRLCFMAGLQSTHERRIEEITELKLTANATIHETVFTRNKLMPLWSALMQMRYRPLEMDLANDGLLRKIINYEMLAGADLLLQEGQLLDWLQNAPNALVSGTAGVIPALNLHIGNYEGELEARLNLNGKHVPNAQLLIAGSTGSGKTNLLAVILQELRRASVETAYPVNFLLFDYKGEFSATEHRSWLSFLEVGKQALLDPLKQPLPINPFRNLQGRNPNEINIYAAELANALSATGEAQVGPNMSGRLTNAVANAYNKTKGAPINFEMVLNEYTALQNEKERERDDSVKAVLRQLVSFRLFSEKDQVDLVRNSYVIKMDAIASNPVGKVLVYFLISKLNDLYEALPKQSSTDELVEIRHFTLIDEAHYMLGFENKPLQNLIAVGRSKGLSVGLATQDMAHFKTKHFNLFANAQYPLIMKQQTLSDGILRDLFGVSGRELQEVRETIAKLQLGELIVRDLEAAELGMGKPFKKIKVRRLI